MSRYYDYCDTYDSYGSGKVLNNSNQIKTFSCSVCKQSKLVLKKSVGDPVFKCEECIASNHNEQDQTQTQEPGWRWFNFF